MTDQPKVGPNRGNAGKGRPKGVPNKANAALKDMILEALSKQGGVDYLARQAEENPASFMSLVGRVLPMTVTGPADDGSHKLVVSWQG